MSLQGLPWGQDGNDYIDHLIDQDVEDFEWMFSHGETPERAAQRMGRKPQALEKRMRRAGRPDLAAPFANYRDVKKKTAAQRRREQQESNDG